MRTFIIWARKARTTGDFDIHDLPAAGKMDLVCRCLSNALCVSQHVRNDTVCWVILEGKPNPPKALLIDGTKLQQWKDDESSIGQLIKDALRGNCPPGISIQKKSFEAIVKEQAATSQLFYLHDKGEDIRAATVQEDVTFVLGDLFGIPTKTEKLLKRLEAKRVSLGPVMLFASQCITLVHNELDRRQYKK